MFAVTIDTLPGFEIKTVIGGVVGVTVRSNNTYSEGVKALSGAVNPRAQQVLARLREDAIARMVERAYHRGANAVVGMRFDHRSVSDGWIEICAYGTAVFVIPVTNIPITNIPITNGSAQQP